MKAAGCTREISWPLDCAPLEVEDARCGSGRGRSGTFEIIQAARLHHSLSIFCIRLACLQELFRWASTNDVRTTKGVCNTIAAAVLIGDRNRSGSLQGSAAPPPAIAGPAWIADWLRPGRLPRIKPRTSVAVQKSASFFRRVRDADF